eukprot:g1761.t1
MDCEPSPSVEIPSDYLKSVAVSAYHLDIVLDAERATYAGSVRIELDITTDLTRQAVGQEDGEASADKGGIGCTSFYVHASPGLQLSAATVNGNPGKVVRAPSSLTHVTRIDVPPEAALHSGTAAIEINFASVISRSRTDGLYMALSKNPKGRNVMEGLGEAEAAQRGDEEGGDAGQRSGSDGREGAVGALRGYATGSVGETIVIGTHLEPTHARELFPCVDLPSRKAVFHLTLRGVPRHLQAISNTPVLHSEDVNGATAVTFLPTPRMPTYVFGFWVGDFHCTSARSLALAAVPSCGAGSLSLPPMPPPPSGEEDSSVLINVHVVKGVGLEGAEFALDLARRAFELFSGLFSVPFPLPKLDVIALPGPMHGLGMENFGAITCLQEYLLVTADTTFVRRRRIARLICHEVSHMWYGDIVTPESFDELWLKEGMARFLEYLAVDYLDPSYHVWNNFMGEVFFQAMLADSQEDSHPVVQQHNGHIASIIESFDTITYCKGASVLRMLSHCVGPDRFLEGIGAFVVTHQYRCATQEDLWKAVQGVCDRDGVALNIRDLMQPWLTRPKFPVLRVRMVGSNLIITQQPYSFFAPPQRVGVSDVDSAATTRVARRACGEGAEGGQSEDAGARSPKLLRTGAPVTGERPLEGRTSAVDVPACGSTEESGGAATHEKSQPARAAWPVPLRIRAAGGSRSFSNGAPAHGVEGNDGAHGGRSNGQPGEETRSVLLTETSTSVFLPCLYCRSDADGSDEGTISAEGTDLEDRDGSQEAGRDRRSYLVVNDGHSGFFTVQYECERSWELALAAVEGGVLDECETMGFVYDLILPLHEGVLIDRRAASLSISGRKESCDGGGEDSSCDVTCLFSRLEKVVQLLGRDRGHPAWSTGQLFMWELLIMCASNELGEIYELSRARGDLVLAQRRLQVSCDQRNVPAAATTRNAAVWAGNEGDTDRGHANVHARSDSTSTPRADADGGQTENSVAAGDLGGGVRDEESAAAATDTLSAIEGRIAAAAQRLRSITADVERACEEAEDHCSCSMAEYTTVGRELGVIRLCKPPLNPLSHDVRVGILEGLKQAQDDGAVSLVVITGGNKAFSAGADIKEMADGHAVRRAPDLLTVVSAIEASRVPVVAAIGGVALGGGCEVALACHLRVASPRASLGLPEVLIGLLPGAGGTQRLPRLVKAEMALGMITTGKMVPAVKALAAGLVDHVVDASAPDLVAAAVAFATGRLSQVAGGLGALRTGGRLLKDPVPVLLAVCDAAAAKIGPPVRGAEPAWSCVEALKAAASDDFVVGMAKEGALFSRLIQSQQSRARRHLFLAERAAFRIPRTPVKPPKIESVGVIGAGTMGAGIAIAFLFAGFRVTLVDAKQENLDKGLAYVERGVLSAARRGKVSKKTAEAVKTLLTPALSIKATKHCDLIVEAVFENMGLKKRIFKELDTTCKASAILCTNTSTLDVDQIARSTNRPSSVMGMHFFSPAHMMPLVECVRGEDSSPVTIAAVMGASKRLKKIGVLVGNCDGFVGNRMLKWYTAETEFLLEEGASPAEVDRAVKTFGMGMGPLEMSDVAGNDISYLIKKERGLLDPAKRDRNERYCSLGDKLVEMGRYGQKTGKGWYNYEKGSRKPLHSPEVAALIDAHRTETGRRPRKISAEEIVERCFYALINEGFRCLEERIAEHPDDIDVVWAYGYAWPGWRGGPMFWADEIGARTLVRQMAKYQELLPDVSHWQPSPLLLRLAETGDTVSGYYAKKAVTSRL